MTMGPGPSLFIVSLILPAWRFYVKPFKLQTLRTATKKGVPVQGLKSLPVCMEDLHEGALLSIVENLAVDLLREISYIDLCICGMFPTVVKVAKYTIQPVGDTYVTSAGLPVHRERQQRPRNRLFNGKPDVFYLSYSSSNNVTTVYTSLISVTSPVAVPSLIGVQNHGGKAPIEDGPGG